MHLLGLILRPLSHGQHRTFLMKSACLARHSNELFELFSAWLTKQIGTIFDVCSSRKNPRYQKDSIKRIAKNTVLLIVHACEGYVRMSVLRNGNLLKRSEPFSGFRRFLVVNVHSGQLRFQVTNDDSRPKAIHLWASTEADKSPYPKLPEDTSVKVLRRTCSTATLQWLRSADEHAEYCIYMRRENANYLEELVSKASNLCEGGLESSELVGCYAHRGPTIEAMLNNDSIGLIETTIVGLSPAKTYRFDLLATPLQHIHAQSLPYRTVWARTTNSLLNVYNIHN
uniref:NDNF_C domain-containing protein n=1 Tax=Angiostrongylus cantonensis TaxID=6313 RepID=A0A158PCM6_ANGCA